MNTGYLLKFWALKREVLWIYKRYWPYGGTHQNQGELILLQFHMDTVNHAQQQSRKDVPA